MKLSLEIPEEKYASCYGLYGLTDHECVACWCGVSMCCSLSL